MGHGDGDMGEIEVGFDSPDDGGTTDEHIEPRFDSSDDPGTGTTEIGPDPSKNTNCANDDAGTTEMGPDPSKNMNCGNDGQIDKQPIVQDEGSLPQGLDLDAKPGPSGTDLQDDNFVKPDGTALSSRAKARLLKRNRYLDISVNKAFMEVLSKNKKRPVIQSSVIADNERNNFEYKCHGKENHDKPIYGCKFNHLLKESLYIFATVGGNNISIFQCLSNGLVDMLLTFDDPDENEKFYCCAWTEDDIGKALLAAAGERGIIRIVSPSLVTNPRNLSGHGGAINELLFHPKDRNLLFSASTDLTIRLWNIGTNLCLTIFGGASGHADDILYADIDRTGSRLVSCGEDHSFKVWKLKKPEIDKVIKRSYKFDQEKSRRSFPFVQEHFPDYSTRNVHGNYSDCAKWFGKCIWSKSSDNSIICWKPGEENEGWETESLKKIIFERKITILRQLDIEDCDIPLIRFSMDYNKKLLAIGNRIGKTYVFDISDPDSDAPCKILSHPECNSTIRHPALSRDGKILICVCDDSTVWRWDVTELKKVEPPVACPVAQVQADDDDDIICLLD